MAFPYQSLQDSGVDVAGAVHEDFLNNFSKSHFKSVSNLYEGSVLFEEFQSRVKVSYQIQEPLSFDLSPIPSTRLRPVLLTHYKDSKKSKNADLFLDVFNPPNLKIDGKKVKITITVFMGHTQTVDFSVDFNWGVEARCMLYFKEYTPEKKAIRMEAIRVAFTKQKDDLLKELADKIKNKISSRPTKVSRSSSEEKDKALPLIAKNDPEWCTKLEKLFLFLVNQVLAIQFTNFINEWELPRAIEIADGASITPSTLTIEDDYLIVGGQVNPTLGPTLSELQAATSQLLSDFAEQHKKEFAGMSDEDFKAWTPNKSSSMKWLKEREKIEKAKSDKSGQSSTKKDYDKNIIVLANNELFNAIASSTLKAQGQDNFHKGIDHLIKAEAGWWFKLGPSSTEIISGGIKVNTAAQIGGYVRGCVPDLDPKNWGDWLCTGVCIQLSTNNKFGVQARPSFEKDGIYCRFSLASGSAIKFAFCNAPGWLNDLVGWITSLFTGALLDILSTIISMFKFKIVNYPSHFPGTGLEWKPRLNSSLSNQLKYLEISGDPTFP